MASKHWGLSLLLLRKKHACQHTSWNVGLTSSTIATMMYLRTSGSPGCSEVSSKVCHYKSSWNDGQTNSAIDTMMHLCNSGFPGCSEVSSKVLHYTSSCNKGVNHFYGQFVSLVMLSNASIQHACSRRKHMVHPLLQPPQPPLECRSNQFDH